MTIASPWKPTKESDGEKRRSVKVHVRHGQQIEDIGNSLSKGKETLSFRFTAESTQAQSWPVIR